MSKNTNENDVVNDKHKKIEIDSNNFNDIVTPNHYIGANINHVM